MMVELDQNLNRVEGREALSLKLGYICKVLKGEVPLTNIGMPIEFFSFDNSKVQSYLSSRLAANGIEANVGLTSKGRLTVYDTDILFQEDL